MFRAELEDRLAAFRFREYLLPINADSGFHSSFALMPQTLRLETTKDYDNYLARLRAFPRYMDEHIARMREGLKAGITVPQVALAGADTAVGPLMPTDPTASPLYAPFRSIPATFPAEERTRLESAGRTAVADAVTPAYAKFRAFLTSEYIPGARTTIAASALPDGAAYYQQLVKRFTTLPLTPEQVHATGLAEVARIRAEMEGVMRSTGFTGDFAAFLTMLRTDPRFYPKTGEQLLKEGSWIAKRMDAKLPSLFGRLPRQPYGVAPVPAYLAPKYTAGRYNGNPPDGTEPGYYWLNTYALDTRPLYNLEALTLHEAVPGHHLQIALANEARGRAEVPAVLVHLGVRRGLGTVLRVARPRSGVLHRSLQQLRTPHVCHVARRAAGRRHRHAREGLDAPAIDRLPVVEHGVVAARVHDGDRSLHQLARTGAVLQDRRAQDPRTARPRRAGTRPEVRSPPLPRCGARQRSVPLPVLEQQIDAFIKAESAR